jgi:hypothetical protein
MNPPSQPDRLDQDYAAAHGQLSESIKGLQEQLRLAKLRTESPLPSDLYAWQMRLGDMTHILASLQSLPPLGNVRRSGGGNPGQWAAWAKQARRIRYHLRKLPDPKTILSFFAPKGDESMESAIVTVCEKYIAWTDNWS